MLNRILLPIDTKSLYYNILNDNLKGHTCTVATPIKQGNSLNKELNKVFLIPKQIDFEKNDDFVRDLVKNSKSDCKISNVFVFDKLSVNGIKMETDVQYCFYVKEEIDRTKVQFGRIKLHYPISLKNDELNIDNRKILNKISDVFNGYAFIVEGFEYNLDSDVLDFKVLLVGYKNIPYSKVFINNKGVGSKYNKQIKNYIDIFDAEIISLRKKYGQLVTIDNFDNYIEKAQEDGRKIVASYIEKNAGESIRVISNDYPYSLYDIQYRVHNQIRYAIVFTTYTNLIYFNLTIYQNQFFNTFDNVDIYIVKDYGCSNSIIRITNKDIEKYSSVMDVVRFIDNW